LVKLLWGTLEVAIEIGQKVKVRRIRDRMPANVVSKLKQNPFEQFVPRREPGQFLDLQLHRLFGGSAAQGQVQRR
jgi:hypothetical protein